MIRKRVPGRDDRAIMALIREQLLPVTRKTIPGVTADSKELAVRLKRNVTYVAARGGNKPYGFITFSCKAGKLIIDMIAVGKRSQGRGIGSRLMKVAERHAAKGGCKSAFVFVSRWNGRAHRFYERLGYRAVGYVPVLQCDVLEKRLGSG